MNDAALPENLFESSKALLSGAREAFADFEKILDDEYKAMPQPEFVMDAEMFPPWSVWRYSLKGRPTTRLRKRAYDVVSDTRNALDQAVYAANRAFGGKAGARNIYYPFADDPTSFEALFAAKGGRCRDVHPELVPHLRAMTPWWSARGSGDNVLRTLGKLAGPNKHQVIIDFNANMAGAEDSSQVEGFVLALNFPPQRLDEFVAANPEFRDALKPTPGRVDFIRAIVQPGTRYGADIRLRFAFFAHEAERLRHMPIDVLLGAFIDRTADRLARLEEIAEARMAASRI